MQLETAAAPGTEEAVEIQDLNDPGEDAERRGYSNAFKLEVI